MLQFQVGTFEGFSDDGDFLLVKMNGPPQPVSMLRQQPGPEEQPSASDPPVTLSKSNKRNKRKADTPHPHDKDAGKELKTKRILLPTGSKGIVYKTDGTTEVVDGPFNGSKLREVIDCAYFQMVPCTVDDLKDKFELWMNEEGQSENELNKEASEIFGKQVFGGELYGNVLVLKCGVVD